MVSGFFGPKSALPSKLAVEGSSPFARFQCTVVRIGALCCINRGFLRGGGFNFITCTGVLLCSAMHQNASVLVRHLVRAGQIIRSAAWRGKLATATRFRLRQRHSSGCPQVLCFCARRDTHLVQSPGNGASAAPVERTNSLISSSLTRPGCIKIQPSQPTFSAASRVVANRPPFGADRHEIS